MTCMTGVVSCVFFNIGSMCVCTEGSMRRPICSMCVCVLAWCSSVDGRRYYCR